MMQILKYIRVGEVFILTGIPVIGVFSGVTEFSFSWKIILLFVAYCMIMGHVYTFNDWADFSNDKLNSQRNNDPIYQKSNSPYRLLLISLILLTIGLLLAVFLSVKVFVIGMLISIVSFSYSSPWTFFKGVPLVSSLVHFVAGILYFLFGYLLDGNKNVYGMLIGVYFGLVYAAGHLNHEIKDYEPDSMVGITTNAIKFGKKKMLYLSFFLITLSNLYCVMLGILQLMPWRIAILPVLGYPVYTYFFIRKNNKGLEYERMIEFRKNYRMLYMVIGIVWFVFLLNGNVLAK
jgi:lycopene elongase/hydratase (dihydrobisanhydrobacterioruberin-forming)